MANEPRLSVQSIKVLGALMTRPEEQLSGAEIAKATQLASGTLYPILLRLEKAGWLQSRWEVEDPRELGRPRRRFYKITAKGAKSLNAAARDLGPVLARFAWS
jgi:PadR family transcriptional regulator PadR